MMVLNITNRERERETCIKIRQDVNYEMLDSNSMENIYTSEDTVIRKSVTRGLEISLPSLKPHPLVNRMSR